MPDAIEDLKSLLRELIGRKDEARAVSQRYFRTAYPRDERGTPADFQPYAVLHMRSLAGDNGRRPISSDLLYWLSPDLLIRPLSGAPGPVTVVAGERYEAEVILRNLGDMPVPSAKIELFLADPTLGFDTRFARPLGIVDAWVPGVGVATARLPFAVSGSEAGHKCLFARAFSFSPPDLPLLATALDPTLDRRVAQRNLTILPASGAVLEFDLVHAPNMAGFLQLRPATARELVATGHPLLLAAQVLDGVEPLAQALRGARFGSLRPGSERVDIAGDGRRQRLISRGEGPSAEAEGEVRRAALAALFRPEGGREAVRERAKLAAGMSELAQRRVQSRLVIEIPPLPLPAGAVAGLHLHASHDDGTSIGGLTLAFANLDKA